MLVPMAGFSEREMDLLLDRKPSALCPIGACLPWKSEEQKCDDREGYGEGSHSISVLQDSRLQEGAGNTCVLCAFLSRCRHS
jgi:hypothetical protein